MPPDPTPREVEPTEAETNVAYGICLGTFDYDDADTQDRVVKAIAHALAAQRAAAAEREREARELLRAWLHSYHAENGPPPLQQTSAWLAGKGDDRG